MSVLDDKSTCAACVAGVCSAHRPLTEEEVRDALVEGRIERKVAEGDHAWATLVNRNAELLTCLRDTHGFLRGLAIHPQLECDYSDVVATIREQAGAVDFVLRKVGG